MPTPDELNARFPAPGVRFEAGRGGLTKAVLTQGGATAEVYLHGAHVTHYRPAGKPPALLLSEKAVFAPGKAIRGGVPICFPWFGDRPGHPESPAHGFARTTAWAVEGVKSAVEEEGRPATLIELTLRLQSDDQTRALWPHDFTARCGVSLSADSLISRLSVQNTGPAAFTYEQAFHAYLAVDNIENVTVAGLGGLTYRDKTDGFREKVQPDEPLTITGETDRVYRRPDKAFNQTVAREGGRTLRVDAAASASTVLWNPWVDKAARMSDFGDDEWRRMLCVETANVGDAAVTLGPGGSYQMGWTLEDC